MERARFKLKLAKGAPYRWLSRWLVDQNFVPMRSGGRWACTPPQVVPSVDCPDYIAGKLVPRISVHRIAADEIANHFHFPSLQRLFGARGTWSR